MYFCRGFVFLFRFFFDVFTVVFVGKGEVVLVRA